MVVENGMNNGFDIYTSESGSCLMPKRAKGQKVSVSMPTVQLSLAVANDMISTN